MLGGCSVMVQAPEFDGFEFDDLPLLKDGLAAAVIDVGWGEVF